MVKAILRNYRQSPRKVRLVADLVRGKKVDRALTVLDFLTKKASEPVRNVIKLAVANARHNFHLDPDKLFIKEIRVDDGVTLMRRMPRARGSAYPIRKRTSHIEVLLATPERPKLEVKTREVEGDEAEEKHEVRA
ncbi:MAG: 50S ribosomal protein L22 [Candidatus Taylorbacteria bacterium RIFCSPHIGHO2_01_FULL_45_63]|uniref:Large ribosomal subunit protein uL22 n=1 Tax=Candidatus Taylorbacteria bacterium RIFCSPHIGHO2_02_FULL_45_35 TaxID=1802311 RepID=A0A1G2MSG6_9BACT|nr:MAG: 50S ribosomal protein L22 [Candidatus Taylorbacteria bacterium RIFCSPHIGHO2_01_FULL_45_63]OHA26818.1 MAG: 50S ribosomal protein L22 [Candidatus Taylorbacteria bacterium RIFCSPHIGHO2_02_FULL_45_35]OHA33621.1 MAG: 50S ribosomal protein L22 [Candidatus Taylorbacteria bacterium RIFCSPLOWO2_01_FULL_45_34b]